ncbi:radical SAM/SPASM domain-containing protein [Pseudomonas sp. 25 E 4]|uniref:radical SAM/SPASM domain-containing protein n=1 Tax=Pseudomonas sp. 25 E 4 TaxID=1844097 RepID=UPI00081289F2|nr:radical SAM/SPASM domain-containing protein [Pseudomonas sp. 25 E 4]CRM12479.1 peptide-modifying radical SAM enzyme CbpB [Pseudomonas sp. 25 E 4]
MKTFELVRKDIPARFNEYNALDRNWMRYAATLQGLIVPPYEVLIHPSSSCNLRCSWCIGEHVPNAEEWRNAENSNIIARDAEIVREGMFLPNRLSDPAAMMHLAEGIVNYKKTVTILTPQGPVNEEFKVETVSFSGLIGEPLSSRKALVPAINYLSKNNVNVGLFTNATILEDDAIDALLRAEYVLISLDADNADTYAKLKFGGRDHGKKLFAKAIGNIRKLVQMRNDYGSALKVNASFILYPENYQELLSAARLAKQMGVDCFRLKQDNSGSKRLSEKQANEAKDLVARAKSELNDEKFTIVSIHKNLTIEETLRDFTQCQITDLMAAVGSDGCLYPCNYHPRPGGVNYGDAAHKSTAFQEVWEGKKRQELKRNLPSICPPTCDPFKNRANKMMQPLKAAHVAEGLQAARVIFENIGV